MSINAHQTQGSTMEELDVWLVADDVATGATSACDNLEAVEIGDKLMTNSFGCSGWARVRLAGPVCGTNTDSVVLICTFQRDLRGLARGDAAHRALTPMAMSAVTSPITKTQINRDSRVVRTCYVYRIGRLVHAGGNRCWHSSLGSYPHR